MRWGVEVKLSDHEMDKVEAVETGWL